MADTSPPNKRMKNDEKEMSDESTKLSALAKAARLIFKEMVELFEKPIEGCTITKTNNVFKWKVMISGPPNTLFAGGLYEAELLFNRHYPLMPPHFRFTTRIWHPNVHRDDGRLFISMLDSRVQTDDYNDNISLEQLLILEQGKEEQEGVPGFAENLEEAAEDQENDEEAADNKHEIIPVEEVRQNIENHEEEGDNSDESSNSSTKSDIFVGEVGSTWSPVCRVQSILVAVASILNDPVVDNPNLTVNQDAAQMYLDWKGNRANSHSYADDIKRCVERSMEAAQSRNLEAPLPYGQSEHQPKSVSPAPLSDPSTIDLSPPDQEKDVESEW